MSQQMVRGLLAGVVLAFASQAVCAEEGPGPILDKAIKALGGEDQLGKVKATKSKSKGTITFMGADNPVNAETTVQGLTHSRQDFEAEFMGNKVKGFTILAGDKGWRNFAGMTMDMDPDALAEAKRVLYLQVVPSLLLPLKGKNFKVEAAADEKIGDKNAKVLKITGPDGKSFTLAFDEATSLPVRLVAKVKDFQGDEFTQTTTFSDYKDFQGIKKATKMESKRDGEKFQTNELVEFKVLDSVDPKTFAEPKE